MVRSDHRIHLLGGGVSGLTTGLLLQLSGYSCRLFAIEHAVDETRGGEPQTFASLHAAASVIPHSVQSAHVEHWILSGLEFFRALQNLPNTGVRFQQHYELFEREVNLPSYVYLFDSVETVSSMTHPHKPQRHNAQVSGWSFNIPFCSVPTYLRFLTVQYLKAGGSLETVPPDTELVDYFQSDTDLFINCTGCMAPAMLSRAAVNPELDDLPEPGEFEKLSDEAEAAGFIRGHYLRVPTRLIVPLDFSMPSYNYTPTPSLYRTSTGESADLYCYPREDVWVLGGSRQQGKLNPDGSWEGEETVGQTVRIVGTQGPIDVPEPILTVNSELVLQATAGRINLQHLYHDNPAAFQAGIGLRFVRHGGDDSIRLGSSRVSYRGQEKYIIHNYGHGGAGYTLSWGCAADVVQLVGRLRGDLNGRNKLRTNATAVPNLVTSLEKLVMTC